MSAAAIDSLALGIISAILIAMFAAAYFIARAFSDRSAKQLTELDSTPDPLAPIDATFDDGAVAAQPTPLPYVDRELERCGTCSTPRASLGADSCWHCGAEFVDAKGAA